MGKLETVGFTVVNYGLAIVFRSTVTCVLKSSIVSDSATPWTVAHQSPLSWEFPGKNTGVGCHFLLQRIFPNQGSSLRLLCLLHWQADSLPLSHLGSALVPQPGIKPTAPAL